MRIKNVVVINDFGSVNGGISQVAIASAKGLNALGLEVKYFCAVAPVDTSLLDKGVHSICLSQTDILRNPSRLAAASTGVWNMYAKDALSRLLEKMDRRNTVVHVHGWPKALSASVFTVIRKLHFPMVFTLHDYFSACPNGGFFDYQRQSICERQAMGFSCVISNCDARNYTHKLWRVLRQSVAKHFALLPSGISDVIYISDLSRRVLEPYFPSTTRWHDLTNPVDISQQPRATAENNAEFLYVGRLAPEKGTELFAQAAEQAGVRARIVGDGELRERIDKQHPNVVTTGWLDALGVHSAMRTARALVFPSLWYETLGLTVQEALANGVPVIVADKTAACESVKPGFNGFLFRQGDVDSLVAAMLNLSDSDLVKSVSENAHTAYWRAPPTLEAHCDSLVTIYQDVLNVHRASVS